MIAERLGSYEILAKLGEGGMGEVYRARDSKLGRSVAIKIILAAVAADSDRVARFEREAKVLAAINHPNIAVLYGMEEWNGQHFLIMELVEGETLAERLLRGPLPVDEGLRIALQVAEALEAAHDRGIIHRDLKPANVKITPDDKVKVLDFGLAKPLPADPSRDIANSPTLSMMASNAGIILGTAAYMSPEQAKGLPADHRSDIFSFGIVLYEMLTGRQPFEGETAPDVLASVLVREPDLQRLPADLNPRIPDLLRRCLEKNPKRRWQAVGDLRAEIEAVMSSPPAAASEVMTAAPQRPLWRRVLPAVAASVVVGILAGAAAWRLKPEPARAIARFPIILPDEQALTATGGKNLDISPDGLHLVYTANGKLFLRSLSSLSATPVQGSETHKNVFSPAFSPNGQDIAFYAVDGRIRRTPVAGGAAVNLCSVPERPFWLTWAGDDVLFTAPDGVWRVSDDGGRPERIVSTSKDERVQRVQMLPDGTTLVVTIAPSGDSPVRWADARIVAYSLKSGTRTVLVEGASDGWYVPSGHLIYVIGGALYAVRFDLSGLVLQGPSVQLVNGVRRAGLSVSGIAWFSVSDTGTLVYTPGRASLNATEQDHVLVDRQGTVTALQLPPAPYRHPRVSPDGKRIAVATDDGKEATVRIYDMGRAAAPRRLTFAGRNRFPIWTPDSSRVVFQSDRHGDAGLYRQNADGSPDAERLTTAAPDESHIPESFHPGGDVMLFSVFKGGEYTLWMYSVREKKPSPLSDVRGSIPIDAVFSPDGKWLAHSSGRLFGNDATIYVRPFPLTGAKFEMPRSATGLPHHPLWLPGGAVLIFNHQAGSLDEMKVLTSPTVTFERSASKPRRFVGTGPPNVRRPFDVMPDGRVLGVAAPGDNESSSPVSQINVVLNWFEELKARVPER